ncbi:50S ribosomal protein L18 [Patescibacteria group bacterium]
MNIKLKNNKRCRRMNRLKNKIIGSQSRFRLTVFRSNKYIYAQIIDDSKGVTICNSDSVKANLKSKMLVAEEVGSNIAKNALDKKIKQVIFDRGSYKYHGRVKSLAEGARKGGLEF